MTIGTRLINATIDIEGVDGIDLDLFRDELFEIFHPLEEFYIVRDLQPGKRMKVRVSESFNMEYITPEDGTFTIVFEMLDAFFESIGTTLTPFEWDADKWQWGMGIPYNDGHKYEHTTSTFKIYNFGNIKINPRSMDLLITIKATTSSYIELINKTTGETFRYNGTLTANDTLRLDGIRTTKNSLSAFRDTNKKLITLVPGVNDFEVKGATVERISFDFRFYYL